MKIQHKKYPAPIIAVASLVVIEAVYLLLYATVTIHKATTTAGGLWGSGNKSLLFLAILYGFFAALLALLGHFFFRGRRWTRSPILVWQLLMIFVSFSGVYSADVAIIVVAPAATILLLLFTKPVTSFLAAQK